MQVLAPSLLLFLASLLILIPMLQSDIANSTESSTNATDLLDNETISSRTTSSGGTDPTSPTKSSRFWTSTSASAATTTTGTEATDWGLFAGKLIGLVIAIILIGLFFGLGAYCFFGDRRKFQRDLYCEQMTVNQAPHDVFHLLADSTDALDLRALRKESAKVAAMQKKRLFGRPGKAMLRYLHSIADEEKEKQDEKKGCVVAVPDCRVPKLLVRQDTRVRIDESPNRSSLHMNRMYDYYGNTILLCQAPTPKQFSDHWLAIWQENVGTVVWVGPLKEKGKIKIDPYISLDKGGTMICGAFSTHTDWEFEGNFDEYQGCYVTVTRGQETRKLCFVHLVAWPDDHIPSEGEIDKLGVAVGYIRTQQRAQGKLEPALPGLLVHCSMGVERSAGFVAVYLGNQMWLEEMKVNVIGILRFVRRHRWKAFGMGEVDVQVRLVFMILEAIAAYYKDPGSCPIRTRKEGKKASPTASPSSSKECGKKSKSVLNV